uniref:Uncharacterized protein n=1 Tax=Avena sativa TaxID=4498 RepID=A0ACD5XB80_AVESA
MARCSRASLILLLLVIACAFIQSSYGSRPSPREPGALTLVVHGHPAEPRHSDGTPKLRPSTEEGATGHRGANADGTTLALVVDGGLVSSEQSNGGALVQQVLSKQPARRILEEGVAGDSAARSSCRSNDARVGCTPALRPAMH